MSLLGLLGTLLTPAEPLHEVTHALFARPFASTSFEWDGASAQTRIDWERGTPVVWVRVTHLAPTIVGVAMGLLSVPFLPLLAGAVRSLGVAVARLLGAPSAASELSLLIAVCLLVNWIVYAYPSRGDRNPFNDADEQS
ncbi:hypothetical protein [Halostella sp. PRR32]|uniref:hypothetical protein n=1 Tax=Halostella sp. PRR32 TaxID=3098147 RepID=UPI00110F6101|nr:hypothetical protein [Halostella sp. PRR32]